MSFPRNGVATVTGSALQTVEDTQGKSAKPVRRQRGRSKKDPVPLDTNKPQAEQNTVPHVQAPNKHAKEHMQASQPKVGSTASVAAKRTRAAAAPAPPAAVTASPVKLSRHGVNSNASNIDQVQHDLAKLLADTDSLLAESE
eukprot:jgi/Chrzof1/9685/Cz04g12040.t1